MRKKNPYEMNKNNYLYIKGQQDPQLIFFTDRHTSCYFYIRKSIYKMQQNPYEINKFKLYLYITGQQDHSQYFPSFRCHFCSHYFLNIFYIYITRWKNWPINEFHFSILNWQKIFPWYIISIFYIAFSDFGCFLQNDYSLKKKVL